MTNDKLERMLHVALHKLDGLQQGQSNHERHLANIEDRLGHVMPLDITGEASVPQPPPIEDDLLIGPTSEDRERALTNVRATRTHLRAIRKARANT